MNECVKGAWVSNRREESYGNSVFAFNANIERIDRAPYLHFALLEIRWRGLQKEIPFVNTPSNPSAQMNEYLSLVGVNMNKSDKLKVIDALKKKGLKNPYVCSVSQVDYVQKNVFKALGAPNLSIDWW